MKSSVIPSVRVEPALRERVEQVLNDGESLSQFVEASVRDSVARRSAQAEFIKRGMASLDAARRDNIYLSADAVVRKLESKLEGKRAEVLEARTARASTVASKE